MSMSLRCTVCSYHRRLREGSARIDFELELMVLIRGVVPMTRGLTQIPVVSTWLFVLGCAGGPGLEGDDAAGLELALIDHGPRDAESLDAPGCAGPNPTDPNNSGTFCVTHFNYVCLDITWHHVCADGEWQCPEPGMILARDCRGWTNMPRRDAGDAGYGYPDSSEDAGHEDTGESDASEDAAALEVGVEDAGGEDAPSGD